MIVVPVHYGSFRCRVLQSKFFVVPVTSSYQVYVQRFFASGVVESELHARYLPVMITPLMLSLKKAAASQGDLWSFGEPTTFTRVKFATPQGLDIRRDEIGMDSVRDGVWGRK